MSWTTLIWLKKKVSRTVPISVFSLPKTWISVGLSSNAVILVKRHEKDFNLHCN